MVTLDDIQGLLAKPFDGDHDELPDRDQSTYRSLDRFRLDSGRQYQQQFGDMYFLRLTKIKPTVERIAAEAFGDIIIGGEPAKKVERVLDVRQGELCWVAGTVYMDMPYKPSILEDVSKDRLLSKPSTVNKYIPEDGDDNELAEGRGSVSVMLEDDSGRIRLVGNVLARVLLVTGCIVAVVGTENENGELEIIDIVFPDLPEQPDRWQVAKPPPGRGNGNGVKKPPAKRLKLDSLDSDDVMPEADDDNHDDDDDDDVDMGGIGGGILGGSRRHPTKGGTKIAIVSGLNLAGPHGPSAVETSLLLEYLLGESLAPDAQRENAHISRLIIAGNSIDPLAQAEKPAEAPDAAPHHKKYGYDSSTYNPVPSTLLDEFLAELLPSMPVTLMPGDHDPSNASIPQQPVHAAMFPKSRVYATAVGGHNPSEQAGWFDPVTNPWEGEIDGWRVLATSGQTIDDIQKYVQSNNRLDMLEATCRWRCCAPTAPDTLWSYPFQEDDPFVLSTCPHLYFVGSQPSFATKVITGPEGQAVRLISVPAFSETREVVLVDSETLDVTRVQIGRA